MGRTLQMNGREPTAVIRDKTIMFQSRKEAVMQPRLLLIEDDPALQTLLVDVFSRAGYEVFTAMPDDSCTWCKKWIQP